MAKSRYDLFKEEVNRTILTSAQREELMRHFDFLVDGLCDSMDSVAQNYNGKYVRNDGSALAVAHRSNDFTAEQARFVGNLSEIAQQKLFHGNTIEPLIFYTNTRFGPEGDLLDALTGKAVKKQKGCPTIARFLGRDSFAGLKLPRSNDTKLPDYTDPYFVDSQKFFYALNSTGHLMTIAEYNDFMSRAFNSEYFDGRFGYRKLDNFVRGIMNDIETSIGEEELDNLHGKRQEVLYRLNHTYCQKYLHGEPFLVTIEDGQLGGDLVDIFAHTIYTPKAIANHIKQQNFAMLSTRPGHENYFGVFDQESYRDMYSFEDPTIWDSIRRDCGYSDEAIKEYHKLVSRYRKQMGVTKVKIAPTSEPVIKKVSRLTASQGQEQVGARKPRQATSSVLKKYPAEFNIARIKMAAPFEVVSKQEPPTYQARDLKTDYDKQMAHLTVFSTLARNRVLDMVGEDKAKALSIADNIIGGFASTVIDFEEVDDDEYCIKYETFMHNFYELAAKRLESGQTLQLGIDRETGSMSPDLEYICKQSNLDMTLAAAIDGLSITQQDKDMPVGSVNFSQQGISITKPAVSQQTPKVKTSTEDSAQ